MQDRKALVVTSYFSPPEEMVQHDSFAGVIDLVVGILLLEDYGIHNYEDALRLK